MSAILLASASRGRAQMLRHAGLDFAAVPAAIDEAALTAGLAAAGQSARNIADALAEAKAVKQSLRHPAATVIGADSTLVLDDGTMLTKPDSPADAMAQLARMAGARHRLFSAVVVAQGGAPIWRHVGEARLWVRPLSDAAIAAYVAAQWDRIRWTVGCYEVEGAGVQLFDRVEGDPWTIIGMPMLPLLGWLRGAGLAA